MNSMLSTPHNVTVLQMLYLKNVHARPQICLETKSGIQTQNDVSMTYNITSFHCLEQKDNVLRIAMI